MENSTLKRTLGGHTASFVTALLLCQPLLDVLSFFMKGLGAAGVTTVLRFLMLVTVSLYGFVLSERKTAYAALYAVITGFWLLHMLNCLRVGDYLDPIGDVGEYLKLIQFPLWVVAFITFFRHREDLPLHIPAMLVANLAIILAVIGLSTLTGTQAYTYDIPQRGVQLGVLGWFGVPNAQSAILSILMPGVLLWALSSQKLWVFCVTVGVSYSLLYATGTRLTYYVGVLLAGAFIVLILISRQHYRFCLPLLLAAALLLLLRGQAPMTARQAIAEDSNTTYQQKTDALLGEDWAYTYQEGEEIPPETLSQIRRLYTEVYGVPGVYGQEVLGGLIERFGVDKVMEAYGFTTQPEKLYHLRLRRLVALGLVWDEKDFLTKLFGFAYGEATIEGFNYDPENDFSALPYYYGYLGTALYGGFILYFVFLVLRGLWENRRELPDFLTVELGCWCLMCIIALGAAQLSGQVLRKPNVTVYFSLAVALVYCHLTPLRETRVFSKYRHKSVVTLKNI